MLDSNVYGAMIDDERRYPVDSREHWDIAYSKAIAELLGRVDFYGCMPIKKELRGAPDVFRARLLDKYAIEAFM